MPETENISKVTDIINDSHIGMFTTINEVGALVSRPLAVQDVKDDGDMWFFTGKGTSQVAHLGADPRVNVSFGKGAEWVGGGDGGSGPGPGEDPRTVEPDG